MGTRRPPRLGNNIPIWRHSPSNGTRRARNFLSSSSAGAADFIYPRRLSGEQFLGALGLLVLLIAAFSIHGATSRSLFQKENGSPPPGGFLEDEVPLTVVSTTPEKLRTGGKISVTGRESLTVRLFLSSTTRASNAYDSLGCSKSSSSSNWATGRRKNA